MKVTYFKDSLSSKILVSYLHPLCKDSIKLNIYWYQNIQKICLARLRKQLIRLVSVLYPRSLLC